MILVLLGTQNNSFNRLLEKLEDCIKRKKIQEEVIVQAGYTKFQSEYMKVFDLIPLEELQQLQDKANIIITHGGVGSIISSIKKGKKVIAVTRLHEYGEHVNNHQIEIVNMFGKEKYIIACNNIDELEQCLIDVINYTPKKYKSGNSMIINIIENFIETN